MTDPSYPLTAALIESLTHIDHTDTDVAHPWLVINASGLTPDLEAALAQRFTLIADHDALAARELTKRDVPPTYLRIAGTSEANTSGQITTDPRARSMATGRTHIAGVHHALIDDDTACHRGLTVAKTASAGVYPVTCKPCLAALAAAPRDTARN
ncbi:hypothetical protein RWH43_10650 [Microbacterium sp. KSW2-21]|uniref:DUF222 domain-containing protein n=1 Tax=Microbacterium algihabitans TaxID=3075992 RepID=A0ABU3RWE7_9MICO|nr:hypothetical protein [Microbacterium sp. KSW2-21]MDU0327213.1 hypothetical protein [Microbacterium sp. KSW2-21]